MNKGKCPKCEKLISEMALSGVTARNPQGTAMEGVVLTCPHCDTILGACLDPVLLANQIIGALKK